MSRKKAITGGPRARRSGGPFTIDASVFVNAFNPHERGHAESLAFLTVVREQGSAIVVPTLLVTEVAAAVARASGDADDALAYARAIARLPHLTFVSLTPTFALQAAELAATHRLRGADAVYVGVARLYGATLVSRDEEQLMRGSAVTSCLLPEKVIAKTQRAR